MDFKNFADGELLKGKLVSFYRGGGGSGGGEKMEGGWNPQRKYVIFLPVWSDGVNGCGWCLGGDKGC